MKREINKEINNIGKDRFNISAEDKILKRIHHTRTLRAMLVTTCVQNKINTLRELYWSIFRSKLEIENSLCVYFEFMFC